MCCSRAFPGDPRQSSSQSVLTSRRYWDTHLPHPLHRNARVVSVSYRLCSCLGNAKKKNPELTSFLLIPHSNGFKFTSFRLASPPSPQQCLKPLSLCSHLATLCTLPVSPDDREYSFPCQPNLHPNTLSLQIPDILLCSKSWAKLLPPSCFKGLFAPLHSAARVSLSLSTSHSSFTPSLALVVQKPSP